MECKEWNLVRVLLQCHKNSWDNVVSEILLLNALGLQGSSLLQLGNGVNLMDPSFQQKLEGEKELLRRAIQKELKIKEGAENLRKATTDRKNLVHIEHVLKSSNRKLEQLHWELQELNARIVITDKEESMTGGSWVTIDWNILLEWFNL